MAKRNWKSSLSKGSAFLFTVLVTGACSLSLNGKVAPEVKPTVTLQSLPETSTGNGTAGNSQGRALVSNLVISPSVVSALGLSAGSVCAQLIELPGGTMSIEFSGSSCPADKKPMTEAEAKFKASYEKMQTGKYDLKMTENNQTKNVGRMQVDLSKETVTLTEFCSATFSTVCHVYVNGGVWNDVLIY